jgi:hypothetical protein
MSASMSLDEMRARCMVPDSYRRLSVVMDLLGSTSRADWFRLLGEEWSGFDNVWTWRGEIRKLLRSASPDELRSMMTPNEAAALAALPEKFTVYRGCYPQNRSGLSWTTDRTVAETFPKYLRFRGRPGEIPILRSGVVSRDRVVLKLDREEQEVIAPQVRAIQEQVLELP